MRTLTIITLTACLALITTPVSAGKFDGWFNKSGWQQEDESWQDKFDKRGKKTTDKDDSTDSGDDTSTGDDPVVDSGDDTSTGDDPVVDSGDDTSTDDDPVVDSGDDTSTGDDPVVDSGDDTSTGDDPVASEPTTKSLQLVWTAPSAREDGTPLTMAELQGYELVYYSESATVEEIVNISGGDSQSYEVTLPEHDTYHFAVAAIDQEGTKSELSAVVSYTWSAQ